MAKYSVYEDRVVLYPKKDKRPIDQQIADWKFLGNADSIEDAYKFFKSKSPNVMYWVTLVGFDKTNPNYTKIKYDVQFQDGKRYWKDPIVAKSKTYWVINPSAGKHYTVTDTEMKKTVKRK